MPDLKTALSAILPEWETDQQRIEKEKHMPQLFKTTNNVTRLTHEYIKQNPGVVQAEVVKALVAQGHKEGSVASLCSQFVRQGLVSRDETTRQLRVVKPFVPLKSNKSARNKFPMLGATHKKERVKKEIKPIVNVMKRKYTKKDGTLNTAQGIAALPPQGREEMRVPVALHLTRGWSAEKEVEKLSVVQARKLYDLLKSIFGG